jgi:DNA-binding HxlR family transcriptional regulator
VTDDPYRADSPLRCILDRIGDKWTVLVIGLLDSGPMRFNLLNKSIEGLSAKVLSRVLKELERDGMVKRSVFPTVPVTVEYDLTALGRTLAQTLDQLSCWAVENIDAVHASQRQYDDMKR